MSSSQYLSKFERAQAIIAYHPKKSEAYYLWEALQVAGSGQNRISGRSMYDGNKRLAILGDAAMALALARPWYGNDDTLGSL
jgi:ribonuclease-3